MTPKDKKVNLKIFASLSISVVDATLLEPIFLFNKNGRKSQWKRKRSKGHFLKFLWSQPNCLTLCTSTIHGDKFSKVALKSAQSVLRKSVDKLLVFQDLEM